MTDMLAACAIVPEDMQSGIAYAVSKSSGGGTEPRSGVRFNGTGLPMLGYPRLDPLRSEMALRQAAAGGGADGLLTAAVPRWGRPEETPICSRSAPVHKARHPTGTSILNDGWAIASMTERARASENGLGVRRRLC